MTFSVIVVCFNAGEKLNQTVESIVSQSVADYEILVKDGGSTDGSLEVLESFARERGAWDRVKIIREADHGIYDAMNQAVRQASGDYLIFMNCGDRFYDAGVLRKVGDALGALSGSREKKAMRVLYGNRYLIPTKSVEYVSPKMTPLTCFRNIPCHQCCFYSASCFEERGYRTDLKVRADYEHFLWLYFEKKADFIYLGLCVAKYEGGGYSESAENVKRSKEEHRAVTRTYMTGWQLFYCRAYLILTMQPLRHFVATNPVLSGAYNKMTKTIYRMLGKS